MATHSNTDDLLAEMSAAFVDLEWVSVMILIGLPMAVVAGFVFGRWRRNVAERHGLDTDLFVGETTLGAFLALLGLLLAFTFGNALTHSFERKSALAVEAAALGSAFLYADLLSEPEASELKQALLDYSETRLLPDVGALRSAEEISAYLAQTLETQSQLWPIALAAFEHPTPAPIVTLVATSITEVLDAHTFRMASLPAPVSDFASWMTIVSAAVALFLLGHRAALLRRPLSWRTFVFCGFLIAIILVILDTQHATEGYIRLDQSVLVTAIAQMEADFAAASQ